jgi:hypothetical protein
MAADGGALPRGTPGAASARITATEAASRVLYP